MEKYEILIGDATETLRTLPDQSVHCCVTSPPYFGLRDYGRDGQIGLEETPEAFVESLVEVFREVRRVLRDDGTVWLNLGDSYGKAKQLIGIPWRVTFALQADGWYLRQDIIWHKPNPMPESVRDRCTKAHEYVFLLSKSPKYYYDHWSAREPVSSNPTTKARNKRSDKGMVGASALHKSSFGQSGRGGFDRKASGIAVCSCVSEIDECHEGPVTMEKDCKICDGSGIVQTRNRRSVWTITAKPYKGAHFATFPPDLIEPCVLAGCPEGGTVLDPFGGSGTTAGVANAHGRQAILCELNPEYAALTDDRVRSIVRDYKGRPSSREKCSEEED